MKPMLKYRGGKSRELDTILKYAPANYDRYIEPFFGGGAMFFRIAPEHAIINDINKPLMRFYSQVADDYARVHGELVSLEAAYEENRAVFESRKTQAPNEHAEDPNEPIYYSMRDAFNGLVDLDLSDAAVYYYINKTAYSGMIRYNSEGLFNVPYGRYKHFNTKMVSEEHSRLLRKAVIMCGDYQQVFDLAQPSDFMFLDPPYDCVFNDYGNKASDQPGGFNEANHRRLAESYRALSCKALMVIGETDLTRELYGDMIVASYDKSYAVNIRNRFKAASRHILVANY